VLRRTAPLLELARRLGRLAGALGGGVPRAVEVEYGGRDEAAQRPVALAALEGMLAGLGAGPVSLVNAQLIAEERGIRVARKSGGAEAGFETTVAVALDGPAGRVRVTGALTGTNHGRVVRIDDYTVDVAPDGWMLVVRNRDVPGVIGLVGTVLGAAGVNIASYHQARRLAPGRDTLAAISLDHALTNGVLEELRRLPDVLDVRLANFGE
jgi:D-3-phosphoglycerate dehydrogenase